jgi:beta-N-acetylhexosaminidase
LNVASDSFNKPGPLLIGIDGTNLSATSKAQLLHPLVGGVVLFTRNFENRQQLESLVAAIRDVRHPRLLVTVDQEGGRVQRFREGFVGLPALGRIGAIARQDPAEAADFAYWHGRVMASDMLGIGIDLSFSPVLDLDRGSEVIGDRAFSDDPESVISLGRAYLAGMHDAGMKTTGKHFPGHGSVQADSHVADVCDERSFEEIESSDLLPFQRLAPDLDAMMIAHVVFPCLDERPAGYSPAWLKDCLRQRIGFEGVIFSDDLGMHAAKTLNSVAGRARAAFEAGCDSALVCRPEDVAELFAEWWGSENPPSTRVSLERLYGERREHSDATREALKQWRNRLERLC